MTQNELKAKYKDILANDVWQRDAHMVDYCVKKAAYIVELDNGDIVTIDKPSIQKDFCFGYSDSRYDTEDYDRANDMARHASKNEDYFKSENLKDINKEIENLSGHGSNRFTYCIGTPYYNQPKTSPLKSVYAVDEYREDMSKHTLLTGENLKRVIDGHKVVRADFTKRLDTYLKRYGMSKINTWSYWRDA